MSDLFRLFWQKFGGLAEIFGRLAEDVMFMYYVELLYYFLRIKKLILSEIERSQREYWEQLEISLSVMNLTQKTFHLVKYSFKQYNYLVHLIEVEELIFFNFEIVCLLADSAFSEFVFTFLSASFSWVEI